MIPSDLSPLWISLKTSASATALAFVLGVGAAAILHRYESRGRGVLDGLLTLPLVLPPTVVGFFLLLIFGRRSAIGQALEHIGLRIAFSWPGTVIAATVVAFPLMYRATIGAFEQVNPNLLGAARTLGASEWRTFRNVLLPLARPGVMAGLVLTFARALGEFGATLMLAGNIPGKTQTMPVAIFFAADGGDMRRALSWVVLIVLLSLATIAGLNYWTPRVRPPRRRAIESRPPGEVLAATYHAGLRNSRGSQNSALRAEIRKRYPDFELSVALSTTGERLGLLGASGSGKSMTLRCIAGLTTPDSGRVELNGRVLLDTGKGVDLSPAERRIGIVFQDYALFPHLTVGDNIGFSLHGRSSEERDQRVRRWAGLMQIESLLNAYPSELSGGQRQRVALARALVMEPDALLLDEPFSALDAHLRRRMEEQLREALESYAGVTILVSHDRDEAFRFCQNLVVLSEGRTAASGPKDEIFRNPRSVAVARLTGCKNFSRLTGARDGFIRAADWECELQVGGLPEGMEFVAIRAHDIRIVGGADGGNVFPCWLVAAVQSPFETTLYLRLHTKPAEGDPSHLEAEVSREEWAQLCDRPQPWQVALDRARLLFLKE